MNIHELLEKPFDYAVVSRLQKKYNLKLKPEQQKKVDGALEKQKSIEGEEYPSDISTDSADLKAWYANFNRNLAGVHEQNNIGKTFALP